MPRPVKQRRIGYIPDNKVFRPGRNSIGIENLSFVETEAIRLADLLHLDQEECAKSMEVSRGTFQRIIQSAREKVARAIIEGRTIEISGGIYRMRDCDFVCKECGHEWHITLKQTEAVEACPACGSPKIQCVHQKDIPCQGCGRHRRGRFK